MNAPFLNTEDCPRCGCWLVERVVCGCGACNTLTCHNCGRYAAPTLARTEYADPDDLIPACTMGHVPHEHKHDYDQLIDAYAKARAN